MQTKEQDVLAQLRAITDMANPEAKAYALNYIAEHLDIADIAKLCAIFWEKERARGEHGDVPLAFVQGLAHEVYKTYERFTLNGAGDPVCPECAEVRERGWPAGDLFALTLVEGDALGDQGMFLAMDAAEPYQRWAPFYLMRCGSCHYMAVVEAGDPGTLGGDEGAFFEEEE